MDIDQYRNRILQGDCLSVLRTLPSNSIQMCVTSPPYFNQRDYEVEGQIGLEKTPEEYVTKLTEVLCEVKRVLRNDGVLWLNLGDSYWTDSPVRKTAKEAFSKKWDKTQTASRGGLRKSAAKSGVFKNKDLIEIPSMVALALRANGWYLRSRMPWIKRNPMPESAQSRPATSIEYVFMLTKTDRNYFDMDAVRVPHVDNWHDRASTWRDGKAKQQKRGDTYHPYGEAKPFENPPNPGGRSFRSNDLFLRSFQGLFEEDGNLLAMVVNTKPYKGAHFAVFPVGLVTPLLKSATSEQGSCPECGAPWERVIELGKVKKLGHAPSRKAKEVILKYRGESGLTHSGMASNQTREKITTGWHPTCKCGSEKTVPCIVLDPFCGSGTVGVVAKQHGRDYILIDMNQKYCEMAENRIKTECMNPGKPVERPPVISGSQKSLLAAW